MDTVLALVGVAMLIGLFLIGGSIGSGREDPRMRHRWDAKFERESRELRRTDATGVLTCRRCGASGSERAGICPRCGAVL
jgi:ribosomal protein L40E